MAQRITFFRFFTRRAVLATALFGICVGGTGVGHAAELLSEKSSDGLVFIVSNDDDLDLWRARLSDGALQRLTHTPGHQERRPQWSDAAKQLLLISRNIDGAMKSQVKVLDPVTGELKGIGPEPDFLQRFPVWSPDGKSIAHTFRMPHVKSKTDSVAGVVIVNLEDNNRQLIARIEQTNHRMLQLDYSSNGRFIIARGRIKNVKNNDKLWMLRHGTKPMAVHQVPSGIYAKPEFTRDDSHVIYTYRARVNRPRDIMSIELAPKSRAIKVASTPQSDDHSASPSPSRDEIVFVSNRDGSHDIFISPLGEGPAVNLTKCSITANMSPLWSPDGERIAYVAIPSDMFSQGNQIPHSIIKVVDRKGKLLFETPGAHPAWMPAWTGNQPVAPSGKQPTKKKVTP
jgi:Tol biopolymer transport system component